jgi:sugar lactone lactonase YvrE
MTVDVEGHVWIAFWDGGCLRRLDPLGKVVREVPLPVRRPTCPVFGGPMLDRLYVTSATVGLDAATLEREPWSGGLLRVDAGVRGRPPARYATR